MALPNIQAEATRDQLDPPRAAIWWLPWLLTCLVFFALELQGHAGDPQSSTATLTQILRADIDALVWLFLLLAAPLLWWIDGRRRTSGRLARQIGSLGRRAWGQTGRIRALCLSALVGAVSLAASASVGARFDNLPPAYHDEYSYLFQAQTFLAGHLSFPSHEGARLFDQMHVLNEGRFASRYFPGAGLWLAPFVAAGHAYWGQWLAGALCAVLMFWVGRELAGDLAGLIAGLLAALSPGMALFSNLLLAHHPTLVGLGLFLLGYLRMIREASRAWALAAGVGLAFAMLCRPLTAAGVAFPFGVHFLLWMWRGGQHWSDFAGGPTDSSTAKSETSPAKRIAITAALAAPLVIALLGLFVYDRAITGSGWVTPYSLYTNIYTPRHVYGFNNVVRGEKRLGPRVLENYDKWAENLTLELAVEHERQRLLASSIWAVGIVPLTLALATGLVLWRQVPSGAWLVLAGIASLHAVYFPYWYVGIDYYHYVFESLPLWGLWTGVVSIVAARTLSTIGRSSIVWWWGTVLAAAVVLNFGISGGVWSAPLWQVTGQVLFARTKHANFDALVARRARPLPALVLVEPDPADRHIDYVTNSPDLKSPVLVARYVPDLVPIAEVKRLFPDRMLFLYRVREESWTRIEGEK